MAKKKLRITKRDGSYTDLNSENYRATARSGGIVNFSFATAITVRITKRDGTFTDIAAPASFHRFSSTMAACPICGNQEGCLTCNWLACGHTGGTPCPQWW